MIEKDIGIGKIFVTDMDFGHVEAGDVSFRERFEKTHGFQPERIAWMKQVHSDLVHTTGPIDGSDVLFPDCDGLFTHQKGLMLITKTADCAPILLWNKKDGLISALHSGWKGFVRGILDGFFATCEKYDVNVADFSAFIGPHLRQRHFEVKEDFVEQLEERHLPYLVHTDGKMFFNLTEGIVNDLMEHGISDIEDWGGSGLIEEPMSTFDSSDYFSFRRWKKTPESERDESYSTFANCILMQ